MEIDIKQLKSLMRALRRYDLNEIEIRQGDEEIVIRRGGGHGGGGLGPSAFPMTTGARGVASGPADFIAGVHPPASGAPAPLVSSEDPSVVVVATPLVGTFYRSSSPTAKPFIEIGATVKAGQVLCIVEAMKLMNEIESDVDGTVVEILVENGKPVEFGEKLFKIKKNG
ncbi:MAG: acetyl-CoA carboxylase biotin carboxyl carrier protein [Deltaproteobacteria bacterium]